MSESSAPVAASQVPVEADPEAKWQRERLAFIAELPVGFNAQVPLKYLELAGRNPRRGKVAPVIESLREFGQHRPAVLQRRTGQVIVGNHMLRAARALGWEALDVYVVEDDDKTALRRALADNATGDQAGWDEEELAAVLSEVGAVPGYEEGELDKLLAKLAPKEEKPEPTYPLVARLNERYDYVVVFATNETDWTWLQTKFDLRHEKSYKSSAVARSHVVTVDRLQEVLGEKPAAEPES